MIYTKADRVQPSSVGAKPAACRACSGPDLAFFPPSGMAYQVCPLLRDKGLLRGFCWHTNGAIGRGCSRYRAMAMSPSPKPSHARYGP
jgi:hypothetical protein